jgi:hypothetical protein
VGLFPDIVTVYNLTGEVDRVATYRRTVLAGVRFDDLVGAVGDASPSLFVRRPTGFVDPVQWPQPRGWTMQPGDLVVPGVCELEMPAASIRDIEAAHRVFRVTGYQPLKLGRRMSLSVGLA